MQLVDDTPFHVASLPGRIRFPAHSRTFLVKGTFALRPDGAAEPVPEAEQLRPTGDETFDGDPHASLRYESDFAPFKPRADVMLVGICHPPGGAPASRCHVALGVDGLRRVVDVFGDREWRGTGLLGRATAPRPFQSMPLRWERAFGGPGHDANPVGLGVGTREGEGGGTLRPLPNLEDPRQLLASRAARPPPAGLGPVARTWAGRARLLGTFRRDYTRTRWPWFPDDHDTGYHNAAPPELQVEGYLRGDERLLFENLHPGRARYESRLPGLRVRCFVLERPAAPAQEGEVGAGGAFREVPMVLDTLWIDMDAERAVLVWRGVAQVRSEECDELELAYTLCEPLDEPEHPLAHYRERLAASLAQAEVAAEGEAPSAGEQPPLEAAGGPPSPDALRAALEGRLERMVSDLHAELGEGGGSFLAPPAEGASGGDVLRAAFEGVGVPPARAAAVGQRLDVPLADHVRAAGGDADELMAALAEVTAPAAPAPDARGEAQAALARGVLPPGADLTGADLSGRALAGLDLRDAVLADANLEGADLGGADLSGANLAGARLAGARLAAARLCGADLSGVQADGVDLAGADLTGADLSGANLRGAVLANAVLAGAIATGVDLSDARLEEARLDAADLSRAILDRARLARASLVDTRLAGSHGEGVDLTRADLTSLRASGEASFSGSSFREAHGARARFDGASLRECDFSGARLPLADFRLAHLERVVFDGCELARAWLTRSVHRGTRLHGANLFQATLERADLSGADLTGASLFQAELWDAVLDGAILDGADLRRTKAAS